MVCDVHSVASLWVVAGCARQASTCAIVLPSGSRQAAAWRRPRTLVDPVVDMAGNIQVLIAASSSYPQADICMLTMELDIDLDGFSTDPLSQRAL